jgi:uncharacterized protein YeaO (DUF488 family)
MAIHVAQLGSPRASGEGPRIGTVRRPPRGVKKDDYARQDYYDAWLPQLSPSAGLIAKLKGGHVAWPAFEKAFRRELSAPDNSRLLDMLATLSRTADFAIGCYCADEKTCHRSILRKVLVERGALVQQERR